MKIYALLFRAAHAATAISCCMATAGPLAGAPDEILGLRVPHLWKAVNDDVYLQEVGEKLLVPQGIRSVALHKDRVYTVVDGLVKELRNGTLEAVAETPREVQRLRSLKDALWA